LPCILAARVRLILGTICRFFSLGCVRGAAEIALMIDRRPRSSYESDWLPYTKVTARSAVRAAIGQMLSSRYEVTQHVPLEMLTLLRQFDDCAKTVRK
jgi:hypothetical protein